MTRAASVRNEDCNSHASRAVILLIALLVSLSSSEGVRRVAAVNDLSAQGVEASSASIISDRLRNEFVKTGAFTIVERAQMETILKEQGFQQSGVCSSEACIVEMGQLLGVESMITGSVGRIGRTFTLGLRLIDVKSGKISASANIDCKCDIDELLSTSTKEAVRELLDELKKGQAVAATTPAKLGTQTASGTTDRAGSSRLTNRLGLKIGLGAGGLAALAAGIILDQNARQHVEKADKAKADFAVAPTDAAAADYKTNRDAATQSALYRNIGYIVAGLCGIGLVLTFTF